jgi:aminoglycoside phosphotransferase (APT) family kinase protein
MVSGQVPFVSASLFKWMEDETQRLWQMADAEEAFHTPAHGPVHGDVNEGNVLVTPARWFVVDWDDIALGDPAVEFAVLLWPMIYRGSRWRDFPIPDMDEGFARRMEICLRAQLLDEVIDPLADYVAARAVPSRQTEVRLAKRMRHEEALERYSTLYS